MTHRALLAGVTLGRAVPVAIMGALNVSPESFHPGSVHTEGADLLAAALAMVGAGDDLQKATEMARKMICEWGMSDRLGPLTFGKNEEHIFLGREVARAKDYSEDTALVIDSEIKRIVMEAASRAKQILQDNLEKLHALARALLERETLDGEEIARILRTRPLQEAGAPA